MNGLRTLLRRTSSPSQGESPATKVAKAPQGWPMLDTRPWSSIWAREQPYADLGQASLAKRPAERDDVIIVTARFRSGSSLLWNAFRMIRAFTAYYQPFHERRWVEPAGRGADNDPTQPMIEDSRREYAAIEGLRGIYKEAWARQNLWMDADSSDPEMNRYVEALIEQAPGRPALQFNRIDFRLGWFRRHFPSATIVHLYRHPRDQWMSTLVDPAKFSPQGTIAQFAPYDYYGLSAWAADLKRQFPFLDEAAIVHSYQWSYYLWKLSFLCGRQHAHISLAYEDLLKDPKTQLIDLFYELRVREATDFHNLARVVEKPRPSRWRKWANEDWFHTHETHCENVLAEFFRSMARQA